MTSQPTPSGIVTKGSEDKRQLPVRLLKKLLPRRLVSPFLPLWHWLRAVAANYKYGRPARGLRVIGVTGTNGKSTTVNLIASILREAGYKVGASSSTNFVVGDEEWENQNNMTVTNPFALQKLLKRMKEANVEWVVLETTSQALDQHRTWGVPIHTAVFTNLSKDHLDYHKTMESYAAAKARLLKMAKHNVVLNHDDPWYGYFAQVSSQNKFTYGTHPDSDVRLTRANLKAHQSKLAFRWREQDLVTQLNLPGKFNAYNALAAATAVLVNDVKPQFVQAGLANLESVPGRMEYINEGQKFNVIVDYAHDGDAFVKVFESVRPLTRGKIIAVFGGHGARDHSRWPGMGKVAGAMGDTVIVTDDEPANEDPDVIRRVIGEYAKKAGDAEVFDIADRKTAIKKAFGLARAGDTVLLLCLGHQQYRAMANGQKVRWDDREVARELLKN
jgi:UDP-N-acetylmuramoyl-L-alanyl-D-glutamate--2,6-diaminopimelate ligase